MPARHAVSRDRGAQHGGSAIASRSSSPGGNSAGSLPTGRELAGKRSLGAVRALEGGGNKQGYSADRDLPGRGPRAGVVAGSRRIRRAARRPGVAPPAAGGG